MKNDTNERDMGCLKTSSIYRLIMIFSAKFVQFNYKGDAKSEINGWRVLCSRRTKKNVRNEI